MFYSAGRLEVAGWAAGSGEEAALAGEIAKSCDAAIKTFQQQLTWSE